MWRWLLLAVLVVAISAGLSVLSMNLPTDSRAKRELDYPILAKTDGPPGRSVVAGDLTHNFGLMTQESKGVHTWVVKNIGEGTVVLQKGPSTCSCTIANFSDNKTEFTLLPGKQTEIRLEWDTKLNSGQFAKEATIYVHNDPDRHEYVFGVEGTVMPPVVTRPEERILDFANIANDESHMQPIAISSPDQPELKITKLTTSNPERVTATYKPLSKDELAMLKFVKGWKIDVTVNPSKSLGAFRHEVTIETDHPKGKELRFVIGGKHVGPISVTPESFRLGGAFASRGATSSVLLWVRGQDQTHFEVEKKPDNARLDIVPVEVKADPAGKSNKKMRQYRATITIPPGAAPGLIRGQVVLKTDHPEAGQVKIPVDITLLGTN